MCRLLNADEIECRVQQITASGCSLLLYKTARVDRAILTETYGELWQNDFKTIDGKMYGGIGIYNKDLQQWLWRWDCGTESNTEKDKGQASDCFKRAGFKWGIGIELYSAPFIWLNVATEKDKISGKYRLSDKYQKYKVVEIGYDDKRNIKKLKIADKDNNVVYELGKFIKPKNDSRPKQVKTISNNNDDLIEGLRACSDLANLKLYFEKYVKSAKNREEFIRVKEEMKKKLYV